MTDITVARRSCQRLMKDISAATAATLAIIAGTAACSSAPSAPAPTASSGPSTTDSLPGYGAPRVQHPLDVSKLQQNPCAVLTATQLQQLGVAAHGQPNVNSATGPFCSWADDDGPSGAHIGVIFINGGLGLTAAYANKQYEQLFQPIPDIEGYPALLVSQADLRGQGHCTLDVGVSDQVAVNVAVIITGGTNPGPNYNNPCAVAQIIAKQMMTTLKGGGA